MVPLVRDDPGEMDRFPGQSSPARPETRALPMLTAERAAAILKKGGVLARTGWGSYRNRPSPRAHHRPVRRQGQARLPRTTSRPNTGPETTPNLRDDHKTSIALPVRLRASFQKTALARRSHLPRRSLLDPHHALRYAERCHGRNLPWDRDDP